MKKPHRGLVDHDAFSGGVGQEKAHRQQETLPGLGHPYIDPRIGGTDGVESQAEMAGNIRQRIPLFHPDHRQPTDHVDVSGNDKVVPLDPIRRVHWKGQRFIQKSPQLGTARHRKDEQQ